MKEPRPARTLKIGPVDLRREVVFIDGKQFTFGDKYTILELGWHVLLTKERPRANWLARRGETRPYDGTNSELRSSSDGMWVTSHPVLVALGLRAWWWRNGRKAVDPTEVPSFDAAVAEVRRREILNDYNECHAGTVPGLARWQA